MLGFFWHITDIHYDTRYRTGGDTGKNCWNNGNAGSMFHRPAGVFGDYNCDSPWSLIESAAKAMKKNGDNVEFVLWTGDGVSHTGDYSTDHQLSVLHNLTRLLGHTFSSQFVFPVLGHEDPKPGAGKNYMKVANLWKHWLPTEAIQTFVKGGYYTIEQKVLRLRLVALNTNLYVKGGEEEDDPAGQWEWLEFVLNKSRRNKETVYLVGHVPPGVDERQSNMFLMPQASFKERFNIKYLRLVRRYSDIIVGQFFGHLHSDTFRIIYSDNGIPVSWMFIAPAISPRRTTSGANNPGIRLYKFDTDTGQVLDYVQYYLDLVTANQRERSEWQPEYNFTSYYGLNEVSPESLHSLAESFITPGETSFYRYFRVNSVRYHQGRITQMCDVTCAYTHYCAITKVDYDKFRGCLEAEPSPFASGCIETRLSYSYNYWICLIVIVWGIR